MGHAVRLEQEPGQPSRRQAGEAVLQWVNAGLQPAPFQPQATTERLDWDTVADLLFTHRLATLALPGLRAALAPVPADVLSQIERFGVLTSRMNAANLLSMRAILPRFKAAGIELVVFKGPIVQQLAYGSLFARPSSDVDLLVAPSDFDRSRPILEAAGYDLAAECQSIWWRAGLGEQHYQGRVSAAATVDLHHRVQQPGCPLPKQMASLIANRRTIEIAGQAVPTLSEVHGHLLTAMSFVKALHHREPAARYVIDFVAYGQRQTPDHWLRLQAEAERQGLGNTVALTLRVCHLLFPGRDDLPQPSTRVLNHVSDAVLWDMTLHPGLKGLQWPRRRTLLRALYDRKLEYPLGFGIMVGSELLRHLAATSRPPSSPETP
ncbi:hypothetical protein BH09PSE1_BH09PSE1_05020 [soil metagenome]